MLFNSVPFMIFLPIAVILYYAVPQKFQKIYLLAVSYYFYACFDLRAVPFIAIATFVSFWAAKAIDKQEDAKSRKNALLIALAVNIGMLLFFKYCNFFAENIVAVANMFGADIQFTRFSILMVTGISFFTFQSVGYVVDVYLKKIKAEENLLTYALFIGFFPHVLAGPISRAAKLMPQFCKEHTFSYDNLRTGLQLMAIGFFKKIAVADVLAMFIGAVHNNLTEYSGLMLIFTAFAYSIQLYGDFSGYSDIARGCAKLLDFDIVDNFSTPYFSTSFSQFWTKWHISLSSWFQDYIFTPFVWTNPMRRFGFENPPVIMGIWLVFLTSGLWHGSAWTFIIWGVLHAIYRTAEDLKRKYWRKADKRPKPLKFWAKVAGVFTLVTFSQIFFRANSVQDAFWYVGHLFTNLSPAVFVSDMFNAIATGFDATPLLIYAYIAYSILVTAVIVYMDWYRQFKLKGKCLTQAFDKMKPAVRLFCYWGIVMLVLAGFIMQNGGYGASASFIYANF